MSAPASQTEWYLARDGQQFGPLSDAELAKFIELGHLQPTDLLWREGFPDWRPAMVVFPPSRRPAAPRPAPSMRPAPAPAPAYTARAPARPYASPRPTRSEPLKPPTLAGSPVIDTRQLAAELINLVLAGTAKGAFYSLGVLGAFLVILLALWVSSSLLVWLLVVDNRYTWLLVNRHFWSVALILLVAYSVIQSRRFDVVTRLRQMLTQEKNLSLAQAELSMLERVKASYAATIAQLSAGILVFLAASLAWNAANRNIFTSGEVSNGSVLMFTLDLVCRGLLFDVMEHFDLSFTTARMNRSNWVYLIFSFLFRLYVSLLILKAIIDNVSIYLRLRRGKLEFEKAYKEVKGELVAGKP